MRHYEVILLIHPDQSDVIEEIKTRQKDFIEENGGKIQRFEDWGRKKLAYSIRKFHKAHFLCFNADMDIELKDKVLSSYRFNDSILRYFVTSTKETVSEISPMMLAETFDGKRSEFLKKVKQSKEYYTFKNVKLLQEFIMETGRIMPRRNTGLSSKQQRHVSKAIKVARTLALLPYCDRHD